MRQRLIERTAVAVHAASLACILHMHNLEASSFRRLHQVAQWSMAPSAGCRGYLRPDGVHVPGPDEHMGAPGQLGGESPDALPADQHHAEGSGAHGCVQREVQPGGGCLRLRAKVGGACSSGSRQQMVVKPAQVTTTISLLGCRDRTCAPRQESVLCLGGGHQETGQLDNAKPPFWSLENA